MTGTLLARQAARLVGQGALVAGAVGVLSFAMTRALPGDAAYRIAAGRYGYDMVDTAAADAVRHELGLDRPASQQLLAWLGDLLRLRLGQSMVSGDPVVEEIAHQLGHTLQLSLAAWVLALVLGLCLGMWSAVRASHWSARWVDPLCTVLRASPAFLLGVVLMLGLGVHLDWLPVAGHGEPIYLVLPAMALALTLLPGMTQVVRTRLQQVLQSDAFEFAQTKGLPPGAALWRHAAAPVALGTLAYAGMQLVLLVEGVVVVESLVAWPGIGHALVHAVISRDVPMIQGTALAMELLFVVLNGLMDAAVQWLDPRLREPAGGSAA
ncbi:ABC transporter permease [Rhodoferax sp.]|uniref:ABC transporter permease n=1 Tax=Rhodoferax sp. TaxID=50421 RepID=UPI002ACED756|nr:ABC transporter permease [Rhodoferax sp.]